jgi:raffinose synthase
MVRASDDFYPKNSASQTIHIASCAYNSVMLGEIAVVDWDMFHSKHECALIHAVARAVSGGPVYVSDGIGNHDVSILRRLVLPGGDVLRTNQPARPTVDCLFSDVMRDGQTALKVFSLNKGGGGVVAAFNVQGSSWDRKARKYVQHNDNVADVCAEVRANQLGTPFLNNAKGSSVGKYAIWSVLGQELNILNSKNEAVSVTIPARSCEVFAVSNVHEVGQYRGLFSRGKEMVIEWAPLGLIDMFNPGGAIVQLLTSRKYYEAKFVVRGCGRLGVYTDRVPSSVTINGRRAEFSYEAARKLLVVDVSGPVANRSISIMW